MARKRLPILRQKLEIALRVGAGWASRRGRRAFMDVAAIQAAPLRRLVPLEDAVLFQVFQQPSVAAINHGNAGGMATLGRGKIVNSEIHTEGFRGIILESHDFLGYSWSRNR